MSYNFPNSPVYGDTFEHYKWDGTKWYYTLGGVPNLSPTGPLDGLSATGAWSVSRKLLTAYGGSYYQDTTPTRVNTLYDQSGNARNLTAGGSNRPTIVTLSGKTVMQYDGVDSILSSAAAMSSFISTTDGYMVVTVRVTTCGSDNVKGNCIFGDPTYSQIGASHTASDAYLIFGYAGGDATVTLGGNTVGVTRVVEWWHTGGVMYGRANGGTTSSTAVGTLSALGSQILLGHWNFASYIYEAAVFTVVPTLAQRNAIVASFKEQAGIA